MFLFFEKRAFLILYTLYYKSVCVTKDAFCVIPVTVSAKSLFLLSDTCIIMYVNFLRDTISVILYLYE